MTSRAGVQCLGDELSEYAAGRLGASREHAWDQHLVACEVCRHAVGQERRLRAALAGAPSMPGDLRVTLLALGRDLQPPAPPVLAGPDPLRLLAPTAPPCHRSALRATVVAAAAAGVSAAAAWSLTVIGAPGVVRPTGAPASPVSATTRVVTHHGTSAFAQVSLTTRTSSPAPSRQQAQSTP
ncbi:hypothetical protein [Arthrobacter sp. NEB 688]|uniref:anti-sigma factor family protein n=1 Tax=Arthrobacter sp. NEB 688 TaxID=904039 RepID=UPI00156470FA|nr:hypothetical protein [Arthrobacter sp. NEB 688]QKE83959.1 hypothetical protein HL663_08415 [Arthrobacter sp. NEB 688]